MDGSGLSILRRAVAVSVLGVVLATGVVTSPVLADDHDRHEHHWDNRRDDHHWGPRRDHDDWRRHEAWRDRDWDRRHHDDNDHHHNNNNDGVKDLLLPGAIGLGAGLLGGYLSDQLSGP